MWYQEPGASSHHSVENNSIIYFIVQAWDIISYQPSGDWKNMIMKLSGVIFFFTETYHFKGVGEWWAEGGGDFY